MWPDLISNNPEILAIFIAVGGFLVAAILARLTERWLMSLESYLRRKMPERLEYLDLGLLRKTLRSAIFFGTLVVFLLFSLHTLGISVVRTWLDLLLQYVPQLLLAGLIIFSGYLAGVVVRSLLAGLLEVNSDHLVPRLAQLLVVMAAVLTGLAQTSIDISFISDVLVILLAFFFGGLSLAFALGSRQLVENLLARRTLDRYRIGDKVRLNDVQGKIIEILDTAVVLESEQGIITVSTARFVDSEVLLLNEDEIEDDAS